MLHKIYQDINLLRNFLLYFLFLLNYGSDDFLQVSFCLILIHYLHQKSFFFSLTSFKIRSIQFLLLVVKNIQA